MGKPIRIYSSRKGVELHIILGKLRSCNIEGIVQDMSFKGMGILHELIVDEKDVDRAHNIIRESDPNANLTHDPIDQSGGVPKKAWSVTVFLLLMLFFWYFLKRWLMVHR